MSQSASKSEYTETFQPEIRRARIDKLTIYEISESELELLEQGSPNSLYLNFAIFLISTAISFTITLFSTNISVGKVYSFFLTSTIIGYIGGALLGILWVKNYQSLSKVVRGIRNRLPLEGEAHIPIAQTSLVINNGSTFEVISAYYGSEKKQVEVTNQLISMIEDERLVVKACNEIVGDPHEGTAKKLLVRYRSYGMVYQVEVDEGEILTLPE